MAAPATAPAPFLSPSTDSALTPHRSSALKVQDPSLLHFTLCSWQFFIFYYIFFIFIFYFYFLFFPLSFCSIISSSFCACLSFILSCHLFLILPSISFHATPFICHVSFNPFLLFVSTLSIPNSQSNYFCSLLPLLSPVIPLSSHLSVSLSHHLSLPLPLPLSLPLPHMITSPGLPKKRIDKKINNTNTYTKVDN
jgi:hypothetical protein